MIDLDEELVLPRFRPDAKTRERNRKPKPVRISIKTTDNRTAVLQLRELNGEYLLEFIKNGVGCLFSTQLAEEDLMELAMYVYEMKLYRSKAEKRKI